MHDLRGTNRVCARCGYAYENQERPVVDPLQEAILPHNLRPTKPGVAAAIAIIIAALILLSSVFFVFMLFRFC